jgi:flagellin-like hook-associated protein FlgL
MSVTAIGSSFALSAQTLVDMRRQLDDLQRQLGTGLRSETYAGVGVDRGMAVGLRARLAAIGSYEDTMTAVSVRLELAQTALNRIDDVETDVQTAVRRANFDLDSTGQTTAQRNARFQLDDVLGMLNSQAGDRYLFSGRAADQPAVETTAHILDGDLARAGFKQIVAERNLADLGTTPLGRLEIPPAAGDVVSINEDVDGSPFGLKLAGVLSNLSNVAVAGPAGSPLEITVDFSGGNPNPGEAVTFSLTLPDGSTQNITLTATASATPAENEFTIEALTGDTADNLQAALTAAVTKVARIALPAASALAAANDFFNIDAANPPRRVDGPPFDTATALISGTPANTVIWYTGEAGSDPARSTAVARVDEAITVQYGLRANEEATRLAVQNIAVFAVATFSPADPEARDKYSELTNRLHDAMSEKSGQQKVFDIVADLASADASLGAARDRHLQTKGVLGGLLNHIEGVSIEEVAAQVLALSTRLQASLQTTALLHQSSLVNYL